MNYICPLCSSPLSESHYHQVVKLQAKKDKVQKGELEKIRKQMVSAQAAVANAKRKQQEIRVKAKRDIETAKSQAADMERRKSAIRDKRLLSRIKKLEEEKKMLQKRTSPQEIGLADEHVLISRLKREFPGDDIQHKGQGGDVLHLVKCHGEDAGIIIYECKRVDRISGDHVQQTAVAKKTRQANYGILVSTGTRRGFAGLDQESGIFIVAQAGVLTLARICRESLVAMVEQRLDAAAKQAAAKRLMDYVTSPLCRTPLEEAICQTERAHKNLVKEIKQHIGDWRDRHEIYETINYDVNHIRQNIGRVLNGDEPFKLEKLRLEPLALPTQTS